MLVGLAMIVATLYPILTLDSVFQKEPLTGRMIARVSWSPDGERFLYVRPSQDPDENLPLLLYDLRTATSRVWLQRGVLRSTPTVLGWSPDGRDVALLGHGTLYVADLAHVRLRKVAEDVDDAQWSPRGDAIAYSHHADLYVATLGARSLRRRLTRGGVPNDLLNGSLDWVYPEELGIKYGFRWSPDGRQIAYITMDERQVTNFPIVDFLRTDNAVEHERYPLAGEANPRVTLRVLDVASARSRLVYDAARCDEYIASFDWIPHSDELEAEILDRAQRTMRVEIWRNASDPPVLLYRQASPSWVDVQPLPFWLHDGRSIWLLDRDKSAGVYLRDKDGSLKKLTGNYRVTDLYGVRPNGTAVLRAAYETRRERSLLEVSADGAVRNLTLEAGWHDIAAAPALNAFVDTFSRLNDPPRVDLIFAQTGESRNLVPEDLGLKARLLPTKMLEVPSTYGPLDAIEIDPPNFDAVKRWPVVMYVYGGPDAPTTSNRFGGLYDQLLAREGVVVFSIDGPASQVDDDAHVRLLLRNFGPGSLLGQEIGARFLASLPYVDASRIGIWGWSFGGYETCYALTHSRLFAAGAAVAPVTDWHLYDTIYTERYMGRPGRHAAAYERSSVLPAAGRLNGPLLIQHGTADNNVHMANSMELLERFIRAHEARVQFYPYPRKTHPIKGLPQQRSVYAHMLDFWRSAFTL